MRRLVLCCLRSNILFKTKHITGKLNTLADKLSRFQFQEAANIAPNLSPVQTFIPSHLLRIWVQHPSTFFRLHSSSSSAFFFCIFNILKVCIPQKLASLSQVETFIHLITSIKGRFVQFHWLLILGELCPILSLIAFICNRLPTQAL